MPLYIVESSAVAENACADALSAELLWGKGLYHSYFLSIILIAKDKI